jgi:hypothetical protein
MRGPRPSGARSLRSAVRPHPAVRLHPAITVFPPASRRPPTSSHLRRPSRPPASRHPRLPSRIPPSACIPPPPSSLPHPAVRQPLAISAVPAVRLNVMHFCIPFGLRRRFPPHVMHFCITFGLRHRLPTSCNAFLHSICRRPAVRQNEVYFYITFGPHPGRPTESGAFSPQARYSRPNLVHFCIKFASTPLASREESTGKGILMYNRGHGGSGLRASGRPLHTYAATRRSI